MSKNIISCQSLRLIINSLVAFSTFIGILSSAAADTPATDMARQILKTTGVKGGLIVHLGCGDGKLTAALHANESFLVHGLDPDSKNVDNARKYIQSLGLYGKVTIDRLSGDRLPYTENLVNLLVAEDIGSVSIDEIMRVLVPNGVAYIKRGGKWQETRKPWPNNIDEWTHHLHGPDGNPVANDTVVGPPKHYQWVAGPLWLRAHDTDSSVSALVTSHGRIFYIVDEAPISLPGDHALPDKWSLVARDAFNGVLLWKLPIKKWGWREWKYTWFTRRPENLPVNLPRRLVAIDDKVYVTLGYHAPVSQLDAATGEILQTYKRTEDTREILYCDGTLILSVYNDGQLKVMAVNADTTEILWESKENYRGSSKEYFDRWTKVGKREPPKIDAVLNPAADGKVVCLIDGQDIVCLDFKTGRQRWRAKVTNKEKALWVGTLILHNKVVLYAKPDKLIGLSAETGKELWSQPKRKLGWLWFQWKDVFVIRGLVWTWSTKFGRLEFRRGRRKYRANWPLYINGYDPLTGELKKQISMGNIFKAPHHHRCYRNKATLRYILASRRGTEFIDLETGKHTVHNWVRGTCHLGMMPANGLQYAPPHPCVCYINEKLNGFNALAPERASDKKSPPHPPVYGGAGSRLERGPAYSLSPDTRRLTVGTPDDWPTFRHDPMRSGATKTALPVKMSTLWNAKLGDKLSPPTIAAGKLFTSLIDEHHVVALNAENGESLWEFTAGARVDTPPTYYRGTVLFGSADGWVYCLRASDGKLVWQFRGAPEDRNIGAFGQLESAWPIHGSILVQNDLAYFAAGRSSHLDGGIYLYAIDPTSGKLVHKANLEGPDMDFDSFTDNIQPAQGALSGIFEGDGQYIYMRSLAFNSKLEQQGRNANRILTLSGFLDDTYFKRMPWRFDGRSIWGRIIVHDDRSVYFVRMFDTLKCLTPDNYFTPAKKGYHLIAKPKHQFSYIRVENSKSLNPVGKPLTVEAWVKASQPDGVVLARGGSASGYALLLKDGKPQFAIRVKDKVSFVSAEENVISKWVHLAGVLTEKKKLEIYIDGKLSGSAEAPSLIVAQPGQAMEIGADAQTGVGDYESPFAFTGTIDEVRIYHRALSQPEIKQHYVNPGQTAPQETSMVLCYSFDNGSAKDKSGNNNDGRLVNVDSIKGKSGNAMRFIGNAGTGWSEHIPIRVRAMVATKRIALSNGRQGRLLFIAGPPDIVDPNDPLGSFEGRKGGMLWVFSAASGKKLAEYKLDSPPVFNGMAAANGRLYISTRSGRVLCMGKSQ